jgi:hypothetical protein
MTGEIKETYLSDLHSRRTDSQQLSFSDFTNSDEYNRLGTTIAVVSDPTGGITDVSDEFIPELGMPENELNNFRKVRSNLDIEDTIKRHNRAVEITGIDSAYNDYIENNNIAQQKIENICHRIKNGETITLICFEKKPKWCHRHLLVEKIEKRLFD